MKGKLGFAVGLWVGAAAGATVAYLYLTPDQPSSADFPGGAIGSPVAVAVAPAGALAESRGQIARLEAENRQLKATVAKLTTIRNSLLKQAQDASPPARKTTPAPAAAAMVAAGAPAPAIAAAEWLNTAQPLTLATLRGRVVVVEFWATWCGPCRKAIPHLIKLHEKYSGRGVVFVGLTNEERQKSQLDEFVAKMGIPYAIGTGSPSGKAYGVRGIPAAFLIGPTGAVIWKGHPMQGLDAALASAVQP